MRTLKTLTAIMLAVAVLSATPAAAEQVTIEFDTELTSLTAAGGPFPLPLASDPTNALGDSVEGYGFVDSAVLITLSSQRPTIPGSRSFGGVTAIPGGLPNVQSAGLPAVPPRQMIYPEQLHGQQFFVDSFFDVFFDITVTDVDPRPGRDYAGMPDGAVLPLVNQGPVHMQVSYGATFDKDAPNFGLIPPPEIFPHATLPAPPYPIKVPLGGDINGNGYDDMIRITLATMAAGDGNRSFITLPDGTVINQYDAVMWLEGDVLDQSADPPFTIGAIVGGPTFGGPTTATSNLLNPVMPEPTTLALLAAGGALLARRRRRR